jgi:hypothetical protein
MGPNQSAIMSGGYSPWQAPLAALFSGISAAAQPGGFANFGQGVQQGQQNFQQGQQQQQMMDLRRMQMEQAQEEMRRANQEREQEQALIANLRNLGGAPGSPTPTMAHGNYGAATGGIQTASGAPMAAMFGGNQQLAAIYDGLLDAGNVDKALAMAADYATQKPEGPETTDDLTEYERAVTQGFKGSFLDYQLALRKAGASSNTSNINMKSYGDIPAGHRLVETPEGVVMEKIPGSPAADAEANRDASAALTADVVTTDINRALEQMDNAVLPTTGLFGSLLSNAPNTAAHDVSKLVLTIKGNIGIDKLQAMRMQSPTGGALGNVTEGELATLQSTIGNLEQSQSDEQFRENLKRVYNLYLDTVHGKNSPHKRYEVKQPKGPSGDSGELRYDSEGNPM